MSERSVEHKYGYLLEKMRQLLRIAEGKYSNTPMDRNLKIRRVLADPVLQEMVNTDHPKLDKSWIVYFSDCCPECLDYKECVKSWKDTHVLEFVGCVRRDSDAPKPTSKDVSS